MDNEFQGPLAYDCWRRYWRRWHKFAYPFGAETHIHIKPERPLDRFFKRIGYSREVQTGDLKFDARYYLSTTTPSFVKAWLDSPGRRVAVDTIFRLGFSDIQIADRQITLIKAGGRDWRKSESGERNHKAVENALAELARDLPKAVDPAGDAVVLAGHYRTAGGHAVGAVLIGFCYVWLFFLGRLGILGRIHPASGTDVFMYSLRWSLPALLTVMLLLFIGLRGSMRAHSLAILYVMALTPLFATAGYQGVKLVNARKDTSRPEYLLQPVVAVDRIVSRRSHTRYYVSHVDPANPAVPHKTRVEYDVYTRARPGENYIRLGIRKGYLGLPWIATKEIVVRYQLTP